MPSRSNNRYRLLVENSRDLVAEVTLDGHFLYVSPNFEPMLGYVPEQLIHTDLFAKVHPEDQALAQAQFSLPEGSATLRFQHRNGSWRWLDITGRDFTLPSGEVRGVLLARDVTDRRRAEEALRHNEQRTRAILENALDAIIGTTASGGIIEWNAPAERLFGWPRREVLGRMLNEVLIPPAEQARHATELAALLQAGEGGSRNLRRETRVLHRAGHEIACELSVTVMHSAAGSGFCFFVRDLTGLKDAQADSARLESQLCQSQKMEAMGRLAGGIAHDFNNILAVIATNNELARLEIGAGHVVSDYHAEIHRACQRAADLVRQILSFSRQQPLERRPLDLCRTAQDAVKMLRSVLPASIEIKTTFAPECPAILADAGQMLQVFLNLATNAAHAMRQTAGRLDISVRPMEADSAAAVAQPESKPGPYVSLVVSDTGHGMDHVTVEKMFEPFFTTKAHGEGTGLGLSVVHGIVKSHGGTILVNSTPGHGTRFQILFPAIENDLPGAKPPASGIPLGNQERILFVEDESAVAESSRRILARLGYVPTVCNGPQDALKLLQQSADPFDCIICDLTMPGGSGLDFARDSRPLRNGIPFVLTSGSSAVLAPEQLQGDGVTAFLAKPFTPQLLAETLRRVLAKTPAPH